MSAALETLILALILLLALIALLRRLAPGLWAALLRRLGRLPPSAEPNPAGGGGCGSGCASCGGCSAALQAAALKHIAVRVERPAAAPAKPAARCH